MGKRDEGLSLGGEPRLLFARRSAYNDIRVYEEPSGARALHLDDSGGVHSRYAVWDVFTYGYWDAFALLPPLVPAGPLALLGLGAGSVARLYRTLWPERRLVAWEIDEAVVEVARAWFDLDARLEVRIADALAPDAEGGFAGLLVDLFCGGTFLRERFLDRATWEGLAGRLLPGGRLMVNLTTREDAALVGEVVARVRDVFGELSSLELEGRNLLVCTGPTPELEPWLAALPTPLHPLAEDWLPGGDPEARPPAAGDGQPP